MVDSRNPEPDFEQLVEIVTGAVLKHLGSDGEAGGKAPETGVNLLWVLAAPCDHVPVLESEMRVLARMGYAQTVAACPDAAGALAAAAGQGQQPYRRLDVVDPAGRPGSVSAALQNIQNVDLVYAGSVNLAQAESIAELDDSEPFAQLVLHCLWQQKPVYVVQDPALAGFHGSEPKGRTPAHSALRRKMDRNRQALSAMGIKRVALDRLAAPITELEAAADAFNRAAGGLLTEKDVNEAHARGVTVIQVPKQTIVTPLARERAHLCGVTIEKQ